MTLRAANSHDRSRGAALIEMAIVVHLLLLLLLGIICFGVLLGYQQTLVHASAEAARVVSVTDGELAQETAAVAAISRSIGPDRSCGDPAVECEVSGPKPCVNEPGLACRTISIRHDHRVDPVVPRLPLLAAALPEVSTAEVTVVVGEVH